LPIEVLSLIPENIKIMVDEKEFTADLLIYLTIKPTRVLLKTDFKEAEMEPIIIPKII